MEYRYDNKWLKSQKHIEEIIIRNEEPFYDTIYFTHYGPVVYEENFPAGSYIENYAMKWTAHNPSFEQKTLYLLNRGRNYDDFVNALQYFECPAQNFVFASVDNDIAMHVQGKFPLKWEGQGRFLLNGANSAHEWQDIIPFSHNPSIINPPQNFLSSANQIPVDSTYPYYVYDFHYEDFRNRRINSRLNELENVRAEEMMALQTDNYNLKAALSLPTMLDNLDTLSLSTTEQEFYSLLKDWGYYNNANLEAPSVYELWWNNFYNLLWDEFDNNSIALNKPEHYNTINFLNQENPIFTDVVNTPENETLEDLFRDSFVQTIDSLKIWEELNEKQYEWGQFKSTSLLHLLKIKSFSRENVNVGGYKHIVNANNERHGVSIRIIVELSDPVKAWTVYPGGQSGNPGSPYYDNFVDEWSRGRYLQVLFLQEVSQNESDLLFTQYLEP